MIDIILLLAGSGSRMGELTKTNHKSLLSINERDSFLSRLLHQLNEFQINKVYTVVGYKSEDIKRELKGYQLNFEIIENKDFRNDTNIGSMVLALKRMCGSYPAIVIEGDVVIDNFTIFQIYSNALKNNTTYYTRGKFTHLQYGGVVQGSNNIVESIKILPFGNQLRDDYYKMSGIMSLSSTLLPQYLKRLIEIRRESQSYYYLEPWIRGEFLEQTFFQDFANQLFDSCNNPDDYESLKKNLKENYLKEVNFEMVEVDKLLPIEKFIKNRIPTVKNKILRDGYWTKPVVIDKKHHLIMDGHHRFEVAKRLGFKKIPAISYDYSKVQIWSLRESELVTHELVRHRALVNDIYPNKTVKHEFPFQLPNIKVKLEELK